MCGERVVNSCPIHLRPPLRRFYGKPNSVLGNSRWGSATGATNTLVENRGELFVPTFTDSRKVQQIRRNNKVELVTLVRQGERVGYVRISGLAMIVQDAGVR